MIGLTDLTAFFEVHRYTAYLVLFLGAYFETLFGPGFFIYGEVFFLAGAILAGVNILDIWLVSFVCILGGILGDSSSYWMGRYYGHKLAKVFFKKNHKHLNLINYRKANRLLHGNGKKMIFFARFLGPLSWITPFIAGTLKIKYKDFLFYNIPGVVLGISQFLIVGYFFGFSYLVFFSKLEQFIFYLLIVIGIFVLVRCFWKFLFVAK